MTARPVWRDKALHDVRAPEQEKTGPFRVNIHDDADQFLS
jgi:hypothetical protein